MRRIFWLFFALIISAPLALYAYRSPFTVGYQNDTLKVGAGQKAGTDVIIGIPAGHFLYKDKTELSFTTLEGIRVESIKYPPSVEHPDPVTGKATRIYPEGEAIISVSFAIPKGASQGLHEVEAMLEFQGCEEKLCLRPEEHILTWKLDVTASESAVSAEPDMKMEESTPVSIRSLLNVSDFKNVISHGRYIAILIAFIAGLLTSLTPCVWPLIPVTLLIIGIHKKGHPLHNLLLSLCLVGGIAVTYSVLGVIAAAAGVQIGFLFQNRVFLILLILFFLAMSLSMFGLFTLQLPHKLNNFFAKLHGTGYRGAFLSGISVGFLATPCVGPVLGPMMVWVAAQKQYLFGAELLGVYALGVGAFYVVVGTFYGTLASRLKGVHAGGLVKKVLGIALLIPAIYYFNTLVPLIGSGPHGHPAAWYDDEPLAISAAAADKKPIMMIFGARWCPPCMELEEELVNNPKLQEEMKRIVVLHVDATFETDEVERVLDKYNVVGWPTVLFVSPNGRIFTDLSVIGSSADSESLARNIGRAIERSSGS